MNLVDEHIGGHLKVVCSNYLLLWALGHTVSEISWVTNLITIFAMYFRGEHFAPKSSLHRPPLLPVAINFHVLSKYLKINPFGLQAAISFL